MKELFSAFGAAVFYPLVSLVLPGLTAISAWFVFFMRWAPLQALVSENHSETALVLLLLSIFTGIVIDDIGMRVESLWLDRRREMLTKGVHLQEWWGYLRKPFPVEPSGRRHLRNLVARLKFELGVPVALVLALPGLWLNPATHYWPAALITGLALGLFLYLLLEAAATHEVLGHLRHELLREPAFSEPLRNSSVHPLRD